MIEFLLWFGSGLIGTMGFYITLAYYDRMGWCPSPIGILAIFLGICGGIVTLLMFAILLASVGLDNITHNEKFMEWLTTPICSNKKKNDQE